MFLRAQEVQSSVLRPGDEPDQAIHIEARQDDEGFFYAVQGLCTSSGVVEAGCKLAIGTRLKRAGMHWTTAGSNAIIALRCSKLSGRFQDFWERRSEPRAA